MDFNGRINALPHRGGAIPVLRSAASWWCDSCPLPIIDYLIIHIPIRA